MFAGFSDKNVCHYSKRTQTCYLLSKRPGCYHSTIKINMRDFSDLSDSLNSLNFTEFNESSAPFRKNSNAYFSLSVWHTRHTMEVSLNYVT